LLASNWRNQASLEEYLRERGIIGIADIDTRRLTRLLREQGAQSGCIMAGDGIDETAALSMARDFPGLKGMDLAKEVTTTEAYTWRQGCWSLVDGLPDERGGGALPWHVVAYDFGVKRNILRMLVDRGCHLTVVPATTPASEVLAMQPDGVFLSNGPGDPEPCDYAITAIRELLDSGLPIFGICLGHQLLSLASGAQTIKMKFGHHGANHPVQALNGKYVMITSQNHGFAVDDASLPDNLVATHRSLFDGSLQGVARTDCAAFSFQGHPEASPGPHDVAPLFDQFIDMIKARTA
jgi:carbamoyl-phosphate synthase small subunit